jgi:phage terminase large subunit-like protein
MSLSNTATPKYYAEFREAVRRGDIPVNREIAMEMNRIDALIADPNIYYDPEPIEGFILYCNNECTLTSGEDLDLLPIFKVWAEQLLCWFYYEERMERVEYEDGRPGRQYVQRMVLMRLINKQYLIVARGAAKSMYASLLQSYFLNMDTDTTHQIAVAPTMKQADETLSPIRTAITRARGPFFKFLTYGSIQNTTGDRNLRQKLISTKKGIENTLTGSILEIRPMTINKLQSLRTKYNTVDEWLSGDLREDVIGAIEQGASKEDDWIILAISSEGTVRNGPGDTIKLELAKILKGEYIDPHTSIWHYKLDDEKEVAEPFLWLKANPNIGLTVTWDTYARAVKRAEQAPVNKNDIMAKRFGLPMEGHTLFFAYADTVPHIRRPRRFMGMACSLGADLSQGDDFCAFTFLFPLRDGSFGVRTRSYITKTTLDKLPGARRTKYEEFIEEGTLVVFEGVILDMIEVYEDLMLHVESQGYDIRTFGYDPYNAKEFVDRYIQDQGTDWGVEKVVQGPRTESVPLGQLKRLAEERMLIFDQLIMQFCMGNSMIKFDSNGGKKLFKQRNENKIDNVAAMMDALVAYNANKEEF